MPTSRNHGRGFVGQESYMELGTVEARGRDGDNSRETSRKYNDHRHSALDLGVNDDAMSDFILEMRPAQNDMGLESLVGPEVRLREAGDLIKYRDLVWMYVGGNQAVPLGVGPGTYFSVDPDTSVGVFRYESMRAQELITMRVITDTPTFEDGAGRLNRGESIGGVLLDLPAHSLSRARPMVRLSVTAGLIPKSSYIVALAQATSLMDQQTRSRFESFIRVRVPFLAQLRLTWDRSGEVDINSVGSPEFGVPVFGGDGSLTLDPVEVRTLSTDGVVTSISEPLALDTERAYVFRLYAGIYSYSDLEVEQQWQIYITDSELDIPEGETLDSYFGPLPGLAGASVAEQISSLLALCTLEVLNSKIIVDNFCGISGSVNDTGRFTLSELPN